MVGLNAAPDGSFVTGTTTPGGTFETFAVRFRVNPARFSSQTFAPAKWVMPFTVSSISLSLIRSRSLEDT